tara:strand:+ start:240 stop:467 length:228 start_codon:yes stop_codon:yes gene_type:complete
MNSKDNFKVQQITHLSNIIVEHYYDIAKKDFVQTLTKYEVSPYLSSEELLIDEVNDTAHIFKYVHALKKILDEND